MNNSFKLKNKKYPKWFYLILVFLPVLFILIFEFTLRAINYGNDYSVFVKISDQFNDYLFFNPKLPQKYFGKNKIVPSVIPDGFKKNKDSNTFRIFALGGSSTAGFPYPPNGSFTRYIKRELQDKYPSRNFEVINLGISAINSITIRDIIDDVIEQKPDLIIIYAGHNEYYGALGPASVNKIFNNQKLIQFILDLKSYRFFQMIENTIYSLTSLLSSHTDKSSSTLMSEMASNNLVNFNSEIFHAGVNQFKENLDHILSKTTSSKIPIILGTLTSNLKQQPLCSYSGCDTLNNYFYKVLNNKEISAVDKKYQLLKIKEKDNLRFRAPEIFNEIIINTADKYDLPVAKLNETFEKFCPDNIVGYELMVDHLHPNLKGNEIISHEFFKIIEQKQFIQKRNITTRKVLKIFSTLDNLFPLTKIDSSYAKFIIQYLTSYFPFTKKNAGNFNWNKVKLTDYSDTLALEAVKKNITWEEAHLLIADKYLKENMFDKYLKEMNALIEDKPFYKFPYLEAVKKLDSKNENKYSNQILLKMFDYFPDFYISKRLADSYYNEKDFKKAYFFLNESLRYNQLDPDIYFKLSSIYFEFKDFRNALIYIKKCLELNSEYPNAENIFKLLTPNLKI